MFIEECVYCAGPRPTVRGRFDSEYCRQQYIERGLKFFEDSRSGELNNPSEEARPVIEDLIQNVWTLQEYIDWINRPEEGVWKGELMSAEEWTESCGITTASELGDILNREYEKEMRKAQY